MIYNLRSWRNKLVKKLYHELTINVISCYEKFIMHKNVSHTSKMVVTANVIYVHVLWSLDNCYSPTQTKQHTHILLQFHTRTKSSPSELKHFSTHHTFSYTLLSDKTNLTSSHHPSTTRQQVIILLHAIIYTLSFSPQHTICTCDTAVHSYLQHLHIQQINTHLSSSAICVFSWICFFFSRWRCSFAFLRFSHSSNELVFFFTFFSCLKA